MRIAMGGTFDILHAGHEALLEAAFALDGEVFIGLTTDKMALETRRDVTPYEVRRRRLESWLRRRGYRAAKVGPIEDAFGPAAYEAFDDIVVSEEREHVAARLNEERKRRGLAPLAVHVVPMVLAEDDAPLASRRIRAKEVDRRGKLLRALHVHVGSTNPVKIRAASNVFRKVFRSPRVKGVRVSSHVAEQPFEERAIEGAMNRAKEALRDADYGVGIEAGLFWNARIQDYLDVQYCAIVDKVGRVTLGHGPGFVYPDSVIERVKAGATVGDTMTRISGKRAIGTTTGAIGYLTKGQLDRTKLTETAILMALVPRIRKDLYRSDRSPSRVLGSP